MGPVTALLHARTGRPFSVGVAASTGLTVTAQVALPDGSAGPLLALADTAEPGVYRAAWAPTVAGVHTLTVAVTAGGPDDVDGLVASVSVTATGPIGLVTAGADAADRASGARVRWPAVDVAGLDCIEAWSAEQVAFWADLATVTLFDDFCRRFPGEESYVRLRPLPRASCLVPVGGSYGLDLFPAVGYPVLEVVEFEDDGVLVDPHGWVVRESRYLVPTGPQGWPAQDRASEAGEAGTWSVTVRYGRRPPPLAVKARDRFLLSMLVVNEPTTAGGLACALPDGTTQISENGRVMTIDPHESASALFEEGKKRWACRKANRSTIVDPAEPTARASSSMLVVPGDPTPAAVAAFRPSGPDYAADLALL